MRGKRKITKEDIAWAKEVKEKCGNKCLICKDTERINAHHLIPREIKEYSHELWNGIALCPKHHRFSFKLSAHQNPIAFIMWFEKNYNWWYKIIRKKLRALEP